MISNITLNKFKELCPQADKNIKYAKDTFLMMLSIARNNVYSEKFSNDDGEIVFFVTTKKIAECLGKDYSQSKIDKIGKYIKMLIYHDLIRILDDEQVPKELLFKAIKYSGTDKRTGKHVNFYAIPSWVIQQLSTIENNGVRWKEKGYRIAGVSFDMFYRSEGFDVAASIYPQYKKSYSDEERKIIYNKSGGRCELCGQRLLFEEMTLDHIVPLSMGGEDSMENLQTACYACNQFKSNILPDDFMDRIIKIFLYQTENKCSKDMKLKIIHKLVEAL